MIRFPESHGGYILELSLIQATSLQIGRLGEFRFPASTYLYFGSACGPGGLRTRLARHLQPALSHPLHWHIDYLRTVAEVQALGYFACPDAPQAARHLECLWSQTIANLAQSSVPIPGFGASDCRLHCQAHLLAIHQPTPARGPVLFETRIQDRLTSTVFAHLRHNFYWLQFDTLDISLDGQP
jgi:Uri superfamily endonuclease